MRRVDAESDSRGVQGRKQTESSYKSRLRKANLEWLESRELLATSLSLLPSPTLSAANTAIAISSSTSALNLTAAPSAGTPSVAVDPIDSNKVVAVWIDTDPTGYNAGNFVAPITSYAEGAYSLNGGVTWTSFPQAYFGARSANVETDFSLTVPTNGTVNKFTEITDASVSFDRNGNFYLLTSAHDAEAANGTSTAGELDVQRFSFVGNDTSTATPPVLAQPVLLTSSPTVVYSWDTPDGGSSADVAVTPVLAVDSNLATYTDPTTNAVQTDKYSGNVYVVWASVDSNTADGPIPSFNPNTIRMAASSNQGNSFTSPSYVDNSSNVNNYNSPVVTNPPMNSSPLHDSAARYAAPQVTISQGSSTQAGGQVTIVYDDYGTQAPLDRILDQSNTVGGTSSQFSYSNGLGDPNIGASIPITVTIADPNFNTLQDLAITTTIAWPNLSEIGAVLVPPTALNNYLKTKLGNSYPGYIDLFQGDIGAASGSADTTGNLGLASGTSFGTGSGTTFDSQAIRSITDGSAGKSAVGFFQPTEFDDGEQVLKLLASLGLKPSAYTDALGNALPGLNGVWMFETDILVADTSTLPKFVNGVTLNFTSGNNPGAPTVTIDTTQTPPKKTSTPNPEVTIADENSAVFVPIPGINSTNTSSLSNPTENQVLANHVTSTGVSGSGNITTAIQPTPILPAPVVASDNTLGSFSMFQGRLYVAFTGMYSDAAAGNTDILLFTSDDFGKTWSSGLQVNDDNAATDGYSASGIVDYGGNVGKTVVGRTQYAPQIVVDQSTGDVVLSFLDARNDPSDARVATYIAASNDGGATFAPEVYANPTSTATNAITGLTVNIGPVPDNQSGNVAPISTVAYGAHQALIVVNGKIIPFWSSNQNAGSNLTIVDSILSLPAGPRIISSTQGPVGRSGDTVNTSRAPSDGTPMANAFVITFDAPINPTATTIAALMANTTVYYKSPSGGTSLALPVTSVTALNTTTVGATQFKITFNPATVLSKFGTYVGTYSYAIAPTGITNRIRTDGPTNDAAGVFGFVAPTGAAAGPIDHFASSSVTVTGHPNQFLIANPTNAALVNAAYPTGNVAGTISATFTASQETGPFAPTPNATDFNVYLVTPDGQRITLSAATFAFPSKTTITLTNAKFTVPTSNTVPLDGTYTLVVVDDTEDVIDGTSDEKITISSWHLTLNGVIASAGTTTAGGTMDQNGNGTGGELPTPTGGPFTNAGDDYVVGQPPQFTTYAAGTLPLIVPGPNVISTAAVTSAGTVVATSSNNLVLNTPVSALQVTFDRNIQVGSLTTSQILSIFGPSGSIPLNNITFTPVSYYSSGSQVPWTGGGVADVFKIGFTTQQLSGTYTLTLGTGILAQDGSAIDANLNAGLDALRVTATNNVTVPVTYPSTAGVQAIPTGTPTNPGILMAPIVVPDDFPIQGDNALTKVAGLTLTLNITYPVDPNLTAYLLAPDGVTQISLFMKVGTGTNTANFSTTTFSDEASTLISNASAPFFGTFKPLEPLSNLQTQDNLNSLGTWTLVIKNSGTPTGTLNSWSLTFQKPVSSTGLGEQPNDRTSTSFQIFNLAPSSSLANSTWTAVGPTGITTSSNGKGTFAGTISTIAVDPSDTTGNTVYVGSASGGIWKTTNFLTTSAGGPTYQPLTDFGPNFSLNIGSIAAFGVNNNPNQTVLFAGTGFGQETTTATAGYPNVDLNSGAGVGILKSTDGGQTWTLLDSLNNALPEAQRDHTFVGTTTYKIIVDPKAELNGNIIVYAALGGTNGGLYRSLDSGNTWTLLSGAIGGPATDVLLDPNSASPTTGNLQILDVAFPNKGVYQSSNQGQTLLPLIGLLGKDPLLVSSGFPAQPITVNNTVTPDVPSSYIVLGRPALTTSVSENLAYQGWLYAAVENPNGTFNGLYITKDDGQNWTLVQLPNLPGAAPVKSTVPTNTTTNTDTFDPTASNDGFSQQGNYDLTLTVNPTDPNIVYIGGSGDFQGSGLIRVDLTNVYDAQNFTSFSNDQTDGGLTNVNGAGGVNVAVPTNGPAKYLPSGGNPEADIINLRYAPNNGLAGVSTFAVNATLVTSNVGTGFVNNGTGVTWSLFDEPLKANAGDTTGSTNIHNVVTYIDPISGDVRLLIGDDEGVFTALVNPDGTLNNGTGSYTQVNYSRNGNLQNEQFFYGAAQPSNAAAQAAGALFYASGQTTIAAQSDPNVLTNGNTTWDNSAVLSPSPGSLTTPPSPRLTAANTAISTSDRSGVGIATDPGGSGAVNEFDVPLLGGNLTDFFRVNQNGQTTGLANNVNAEFPRSGNRVSGTTGNDLAGAVANGQIVQGNFTVNSLNGNQMLIASATQNLYETTNDGVQWLLIGNAGNFDGTSISALAYGAPDPNAPDGVGNLDNFIYAGTSGSVNGGKGQIFVTQGDGSNWTNISSGLDGASVVGIYPDPNRGSHAAYAVTLTGIFYSSDTVGLSNAGQTVWTPITNNLTSIQYNPFGNAAYQQSVFAGFNSNSGTTNQGTAQYGGFTSIVADYRYLIPAASNTPGGTSNVFYPVLYVSGYGGVFDSIDNGATWSVFPNTTFNNAPVDGGYLPHVDVTNLQLVLGNINPDTGHALQTPGDPEVLLASTFGRGEFAIGLAPDVFPSTIALDTTLPAPNGSDSGAVRGFPNYTNVTNPYIDGTSEVTNYGNVVTIDIYDESGPTPVLIGTGTTDAFGQFQIQILAQNTNPTGLYYDKPFLVDNLKTIGIQATDSAGASGNVATFTYNLKATPPANPTNLTLTNDSGRVTNDDKSKLVPPNFSVGTTEPASTEVELVRLTYNAITKTFTAPYEVVNTVAAGTSTVNLTDTLLSTELAGSTIDQLVTYYVVQIDLANNPSTPITPLSSIVSDSTKLTILLDNVLPPSLAAPKLEAGSNSSGSSSNITNNLAPIFDAPDLLPTGAVTATSVSPYNLQLFRSKNGSTPIQVGTALPGVQSVQDTSGTLTNGVYVYYVVQVDLVGNVSPIVLTNGTTVTIDTTHPAIPTLQLDQALDKTGAPTYPNVTSTNAPYFIGTGTPGLPIVLVNSDTGQVLTSPVTVTANGTFLAQILGPVADGTYNIVALTTNAAGNYTESNGVTGPKPVTAATLKPLTITIKHQGPVIVPTLSLLPANDTGIKGDGVTANHHPAFIGTTDKGDVVTLYSIVNGVLSAPQATTTSSTVNGTFSFQLPFNLTDGTAELVARSTDNAGNAGPLSSPLYVRIISVAGDYTGSGTANLSVFNPSNETYYVQNVGAVQADTTPGRDVPIEYDFNGDGSTDYVAYRFNAAQYYGTLQGNGSSVATFFGQPGVGLPVSGYYGGYGSYIYATFSPLTATWSIAVPVAGGQVTQFGAAKIDIPAPAAYDGNGITEIATFRPVTVAGGDADSFNVDSASGYYQVSFTSPAVSKLGFVYKAGDIPAPADYDGVGKDEFAIYRPSTGQFFILNTPNPLNSATWTMRTVTLNLPGGPNVNDVPTSEDYDGNGKADPTVYRPSNSTFYIIHSSTGLQQNVPFGTPGGSVAASGPLLYRLTALQGAYATTDGYSGVGGLPGSSSPVAHTITPAVTVHTESIASASSSTTSTSSSSSSPISTMIAVASPMPVTTAIPVPAPTSTVVPASVTPATSAVVIGASTPKLFIPTVTEKVKSSHVVKTDKEKTIKLTKAVKPLTVETKSHAVEATTVAEHPKVKTASKTDKTTTLGHQTTLATAGIALQKLVLAKKGHKKA